MTLKKCYCSEMGDKEQGFSFFSSEIEKKIFYLFHLTICMVSYYLKNLIDVTIYLLVNILMFYFSL